MNYPVFEIKVPPYPNVKVASCSKADFDGLTAVLSDTAAAVEIAERLTGTEGISLTSTMVFIREYLGAIYGYMKEHPQRFRYPERPSFFHPEDNGGEELQMPIPTYENHLIYSYSGIDFQRQRELNVLDYYAYLADAAKAKILSRADGKGVEYLNECYDFMMNGEEE